MRSSTLIVSDIELVVEEEIGWICFNRPEVSNAVRPETMHKLCEVLDKCSRDDSVKAIILTGNGKHFSAGADFTFLEQLTRNESELTRQSLYEWFVGAARRLWRSSKPTIGAVNGAAITVGCELALACDVRIVDHNATLRESWLQLGLLPPLGGSVLLPRLIGIGRAKEAILNARSITAKEATEIGLASEVVPPGELRAAALRLARTLAAHPQPAYRLAKEALQRPFEADLEREWQANVIAQSMLIGTEEFRKRVAAQRRRSGAP
jgi:enoyl-CoA hydratase/carnithine racemase